jgi:hypothetical protein
MSFSSQENLGSIFAFTMKLGSSEDDVTVNDQSEDMF